jgi:hypothetical protein
MEIHKGGTTLPLPPDRSVIKSRQGAGDAKKL